MKILIVHNKYQHIGGEDMVVDAEAQLLVSHGHFVEKLIFDNNAIHSLKDKIILVTGLLHNRVSARMLERKIVTLRPDIIHVHNFHFMASPSIFYTARRHNIPVIHTLHNFRLICPSATLFFENRVYERSVHNAFPLHAIINGVYRNSITQTAAVALITAFHHFIGTWRNQVDKYICLSNFGLSKFKESFLQIPENKFSVKPNFVHDHGIGKKNRDNSFLYVGRLSPEKGLDTLLRAAIMGRFNVVIVGDGPLKSDVESVASKHPNVRYLGFKSREQVLQLLKACKALIFPSICYEGFGLSIVEAFSVGTPVIASNTGSMAELVKNYSNGLHFIPGNEADLCEKVTLIARDPEKYIEMSANARRTYLQNYTPEKNYRMLMDIYYTQITRGRLRVKQYHVPGLEVMEANELVKSMTLNARGI